MSDDWTGFADEAVANSGSKAPGCTFGTFINSLSGEDADEVIAALNNKAVTNSAIGRGIRLRGVVMSDFTVGRHRRGSCSCSRRTEF